MTAATRTCRCGCGKTVTRDDRAHYATAACKQRAHRARRRVSRLTAVQTGAVDLPRMRPSTRRVLMALLAVGARGATTRDLCQPDVGGIRVSARVFELREMGWRISVQQERPGSYRYRLLESDASRRLFDTESVAA